jgi:hypothetical protein
MVVGEGEGWDIGAFLKCLLIGSELQSLRAWLVIFRPQKRPREVGGPEARVPHFSIAARLALAAMIVHPKFLSLDRF